VIKVVGYARVSSEEQAAKDLSIPAQIKAIHAHVDGQTDMTLVEMFKDEGISAYASADKRPGFMAMIKLAKDTDVTLILVHKLDRFSRNREESIIFKSLLKKQNVQVKSITENFDPDTPSGFLFEGIIEVMNQFYSMNLGMETRKGMVENVQRGYWNGGVAPYGYGKMDVAGRGDRTHKKLTLGDPVEVATVRRMFDWAVNEGLGAKAIAKRLVMENIPYRSNQKWCKQRVTYILNNHVYYGAGIWNRTHTKTRTLKPESEWIIQEGNHDAIITKEMFLKRKEMGIAAGGDKFKSNAHKCEWLLSKMIRCGDCGKAYIGVRRKRINWSKEKKFSFYLNRYVCSGHVSQGTSGCASFYIDREFLEESVIKLIKHEFAHPEKLAQIERAVHVRIKQAESKRDDTEVQYRQRLNEIIQGIERYYDAIATGLDPDVCKRKIDELSQQRAVLEGELLDKETGVRMARQFEDDLAVVRSMTHHFSTEFMKLPFERRRLIILHFVERIDILDHATASVTLRLPKLTPGAVLKPHMAKLTRHEIALKEYSEQRKNGKTPPDSSNQVGLVTLPDLSANDPNNWFASDYRIELPIYLGNGFVVSPSTAIGKVGLFGCPSRG